MLKNLGEDLVEIVLNVIMIVESATLEEIQALLKNGIKDVKGKIRKVFVEGEIITEEETGKFRKIFDEVDGQGGKILSWKQIKRLRDFLRENYGIELEVVKKNTAKWKRWTSNGNKLINPNTVGSFIAGPPPTMYILENVSELTVFHEMVHVKLWKSLSAEEMAALHIVEEETMVWEEIFKSRERWTNDELIESYRYVNENVIYKANKKGGNFKKIYNQEMEDLILNKQLGIR